MRGITNEKQLSNLIEKLLEEAAEHKVQQENGDTPSFENTKAPGTTENYFSRAETEELTDYKASGELSPGVAWVQNNEINYKGKYSSP